MYALLGEIRMAVRRLLSDRWAAAAAILAAAIGAGLNTAVFAIAYGVLLRPLPYPDAGRLMTLDVEMPFAHIEQWRARLLHFQHVAGYVREARAVRGAGDPRLVPVAIVSVGFFETLGVRPRAGRAFTADEPPAMAVVSDTFVRQTGLSPETILGRTLTVGDAALTVAGVMPAGFAFPSDQADVSAQVEVWMPARAAHAIAFDRSPDARRFRLVGRLAPGASLAQVQEEVNQARIAIDPDARSAAERITPVEPVYETLVRPVRPVLVAFAAAAVMVLLVACANIASILVGRTVSRARELAVRRALGASPARLLTSILAESLLLSAAGTALGVLLAFGSVSLVEKWAAGIVPRLDAIRIDWAVLLLASLVAVMSAILASLPAFRTVRSSVTSLRASGAAPTRVDRRTRGVLIVAQIALAVVLLAGGALLTRTIVGLLHADIGIESRGAAVTQLILTPTRGFDGAPREPLMQELLRRVRELRGVIAAGAGSSLPPDNAQIEMRVRIVTDGREERHSLSLAAVTPGYLPAIGVRLLQGRDFEEADTRRGPPVAVLSESASRALMRGTTDPVGKELPIQLPGPLRERGRAMVVGVVSDVKYTGLDAPAGAAIYVMWRELPLGQIYLAVRAQGHPLGPAPAVRAIFRELDPAMPIMPFRALDEVMERSVADRRLRALLGGSVALLAFALALVGLAGSLMRMVFERRQELAIRAALGATRADAVRTVVTEGGILALIGIVLGLLGALAEGRALGTMLHGVSPHDPATLAAVAGTVGLMSLLACYLPARRAADVDPMEVLRETR